MKNQEITMVERSNSRERIALGLAGVLLILFFFAPNFSTAFQDENSLLVVKGVVKSKEGRSLPGVKIFVQGELKATTSLKGEFTSNIKKNSELEFSFPGFKELRLKVIDNRYLEVELEIAPLDTKQGDTEFIPFFEVEKEAGGFYLVGKVVTKENKPVYAMDVLVPKQRLKTTTNADGEFRIKLKEERGRVIFGFPNESGKYFDIVSRGFE